MKQTPKLLLTLFMALTLALNLSLASAAPAPQAEQTIADLVSANEQLTTLNTTIQFAGLADTLSNEGPYTLFAPTDAAFEALPDGMLDSLMADTERLQAVLLYHVVNDTITADDIPGMQQATSVEGGPVDFTMSDGNAMIEEANIIQTDIMAYNGVIHVIDTVLLPPADTQPSDLQPSEEVIVACAVEYVVQNDDWLSRLADRYYGDPLMFPVIFEATNQAASADETYVTIQDADIIEVGQKLCVPNETDAQAIMARITDNIAAGGADDSAAMTADDSGMTAEEELPIPGEMAAVEEPVDAPPVETADDGEAMIDVTEPDGADLSNLTVVDIAMQDGRLDTLVEALQTVDLVETLQGVGPFTLFAPTDAAFETLPAGVLDNLEANQDQLRDVLLNHVVVGQQLAASEVTATNMITTAQNAAVDVRVEGDNVMIDSATVVQPDIQASNGIIHVIDSVLMPGEM